MPETTVGKIAAYLEDLAPLAWAESWDNVGLQVGDPLRRLDRVMVALELTERTAREVLEKRADLLVVHHPVIFKPLRAIRFDSPAGRRLEQLIQAGVAVYAAHTNLDQAKGGTNERLAEAVGLNPSGLLLRIGEERYVKLVVFVPQGHEEAVRSALAGAGAGHIGNYSHCTFQTPGTGTFLPQPGANPFLGELGKLEVASEYRLETILPESRVPQAVQAMMAAHPYEEVAYDLYPLANPGRERGLGLIGRLPEWITLGVMARQVKERLGIDHLRMVGDPDTVVANVAVGAGSGGMLIPHAIARRADLLITGDIDHHEALDALDAGLAILDVGHWVSERLVVAPLAQYLRERLAQDGLVAEVLEAESERDPFRFV